MATTARFITDSIAQWPLFLPILLLCSAFIGDCAGPTGGELKVIFILLLFARLVRIETFGASKLPFTPFFAV